MWSSDIAGPGQLLIWVLAVAALAALLVTVLADRAVALGLSRSPPAPPAEWPAVSIFKPVKGLDDGLYENLASLARQDYPRFEILVGAAEAEDPALEVARRVARDHPKVAVRVLVCRADGGLNPKVSILRSLSRHAANDLSLISDSNVRVQPQYLRATVRELGDPTVRLVTNPVVSCGEEDLGARLEALHLVTYVARALTFASTYLRRACVVGKSMLFRRSDLDRLGGWALVRDLLAEDYAIGRAFELAGFRIVSAPHIVQAHARRWTVQRFANRHLRWAQMRRWVCLPAYLGEPLFNPNVLLLALAGVALIFGIGPLLVLSLGGLLLRGWSDRRLLRRMCGRTPSWWDLLLLVPKDLFVLGLWVVALFRRSVDWRGNLLVIGPGTRLQPRNQVVAEPAQALHRIAMWVGDSERHGTDIRNAGP